MTYKYVEPKFCLAFDTETSGYSFPNYADKHQMISFGACVVLNETLEVVESTYQEIKFDPNLRFSEWSKEAEAVHGLSIDYLNKNGVSMEEGCAELLNLILKYWGTESPVMIMGHNPKFDIAFMESSFKMANLPMPKLHHRLIDSSVAGFVALNIVRSEELFTKLGLPERKEHNALEDTLYMVEAMRNIRTIFKSVIE